MKVHRIDHVGVIVNDLAAAKAFFFEGKRRTSFLF
jgi:catechol 2,3-dioxygenase-like lactoylglutathione lyase family enzyme